MAIISASEIAEIVGAELVGADVALTRVASLSKATKECLGFYSHSRYKDALGQTSAGAVLIAGENADLAPCVKLVSANPELAFARAIELLHPRKRAGHGVHSTAVVHPSATIDATASVGPLCVVEAEVDLGPGVEVGPNCVVGAGTRIGRDSRLVANVVVCEGTQIGERALLHPGAVVGREGFGFVKEGERWVRVPQIGRVRLGNDVEIGSNTAVDRGAIDDTVIEDGVKIDNLIQIGHNVSVGANTAMAACSGISGSTRIGKRCTLAGAVGVAGHLEIGDDVHFSGMAMVTRSRTAAGVYSSGIPAMPNREWRRTMVRLKGLDALSKRVQELENALERALLLADTDETAKEPDRSEPSA
jgi:UDP-3-O-[3-hydroxymyristoyl] glucosamine N-acyltransferase